MKLPGELLERLSKALLAAFPNYSDLEQLLRFKLDHNLADITNESDQVSVVFRLLQWAEANDCVEDLFEQACEHNRGNKTLRSAYHIILVHIELLGAFQTNTALRQIVENDLHVPRSVMNLDDEVISEEMLVKATFRLIVWVEKYLELNQLVTTALRAQGSHAGLQRALAAIDPSNALKGSRMAENVRATDYQQVVEQISALLKQESQKKYIGETFKAFIHTLTLVGDSLRQAPNNQPVYEAFAALGAALAQLREESALAAQVRVGDYQSCFRLAAEEDEDAALTSFIDLGFLKELTGDPARPASAIVLGAAGHGKTSYCRMLARAVNQRALVVTLNVDAPLRNALPLSEHEWLAQIRRQTLITLTAELANNSQRRARLEQNIPAASAYYFAHLASDLAEFPLSVRPTPAELATLAAQCSNDLLRWLELLARVIASGARYESVYLLVDVKDNRRCETSWLFDQLLPMVNLLASVHTVGFAFKLFLPARLKALVEPKLAPITPHIRFFELDWAAPELENMLSVRLSTHEIAAQTTVKTGPVAKFSHLCEEGLDFLPDTLLVNAALEHKIQRYSPRKLMALAWSTINLHLARYPEDTSYISAATIEAILEI